MALVGKTPVPLTMGLATLGFAYRRDVEAYHMPCFAREKTGPSPNPLKIPKQFFPGNSTPGAFLEPKNCSHNVPASE